MDGRRIRNLKARVRRERCINRGEPDGPGSTVEGYKMEESEEEVTVLVGFGSPEGAGREAPGVRAASVLNLEKERIEHFK